MSADVRLIAIRKRDHVPAGDFYLGGNRICDALPEDGWEETEFGDVRPIDAKIAHGWLDENRELDVYDSCWEDALAFLTQDRGRAYVYFLVVT